MLIYLFNMVIFPVRSVKLEGKLKLEIPLTSIHFIVLYPP